MDETQEQNQQRRKAANRLAIETFTEIGNEFEKKGIHFDKKALKHIEEDPPHTTKFPYIIVALSVFKDVVDVADVTIVGVIFTTLLTGLATCIIFLWCLGKIKGGFWKKPLLRWLIMWGLATFFVEIVPYIKIAPANTIFVLMAHYRHKKIVQLVNFALEKLHEANIMGPHNKGGVRKPHKSSGTKRDFRNRGEQDRAGDIDMAA